MLLSEVAASLYAWDLADEGPEQVMDEMEARCQASSFYLVGVMHHEKRPLTSLFFTHNPKGNFTFQRTAAPTIAWMTGPFVTCA